MDYNFLWGVIALTCGAVMLVYGASMFRVVLLVAGFYIGFALVNVLLGSISGGPGPGVRNAIAIVLGAAAGFVLFSMARLTVYAAGAMLGLVAAMFLASLLGFSRGWAVWIIGLGGTGLGAFLGPHLGRSLTIISSAVAGSYVTVIGLARLFGVPEAMAAGTMPVNSRTLTVFILLAVISILAQSRVGELKRVG